MNVAALGDGTGAAPVEDDLIQPFQIEGCGVRGRLARLGPLADEVLGRQDYPAPVAALLGETLALAAVLAGALKYEGIFTLQAVGDGPVKMIVADMLSAHLVEPFFRMPAGRNTTSRSVERCAATGQRATPSRDTLTPPLTARRAR